MCLFGSTSPSYLVLQSLDLTNDWLEKTAPAAFSKTVERVNAMKTILTHEGLVLAGEEPLKLTVDCVASRVGSGLTFADRLRDFDIECEYADRDVVVLMFAPNNTDDDYQKLSIAVHMLMQVQRHIPESNLERPNFSGRLPERRRTSRRAAPPDRDRPGLRRGRTHCCRRPHRLSAGGAAGGPRRTGGPECHCRHGVLQHPKHLCLEIKIRFAKGKAQNAGMRSVPVLYYSGSFILWSPASRRPCSGPSRG